MAAFERAAVVDVGGGRLDRSLDGRGRLRSGPPAEPQVLVLREEPPPRAGSGPWAATGPGRASGSHGQDRAERQASGRSAMVVGRIGLIAITSSSGTVVPSGMWRSAGGGPVADRRGGRRRPSKSQPGGTRRAAGSGAETGDQDGEPVRDRVRARRGAVPSRRSSARDGPVPACTDSQETRATVDVGDDDGLASRSASRIDASPVVRVGRDDRAGEAAAAAYGDEAVAVEADEVAELGIGDEADAAGHRVEEPRPAGDAHRRTASPAPDRRRPS